MPVHVVIHRNRLPRVFRERGALLEERRYHRVRAGGNVHPGVQMLVGDLIVVQAVLRRPHRLHGEQLDARSVEQDVQLVFFDESFHVLVAVPRQPNLDLVLAVDRECVVDRGAAARAEGQLFEVVFLRALDRKSNGFVSGVDTGAPTARRLIFRAAVRYRSRSPGETLVRFTLSKP